MPFVKGDSRINRNGAPKGQREKKFMKPEDIEQGKLALIPDALKVIKSLLNGKDVPPTVQFATAKYLLDEARKQDEMVKLAEERIAKEKELSANKQVVEPVKEELPSNVQPLFSPVAVVS